MAMNSLVVISKMIAATSESKEDADKAIAQFKRLDDAANLIFDKLFNQQTTESQNAHRH